MKFRKFFSLTLAVATTAAALPNLVGCRGGSTNGGGDIGAYYNTETGEIKVEEDVTIEFWLQTSEQSSKIYNAMVDNFRAENPNITVNMTEYNATNYQMTITNQAASGDLPDLFYVPDTEFYYWVSNDMLWDYSDYVKQAELDAIWKDSYERYLYNVETKTIGFSENSGLYGLPKDLGPYEFCCNVDLLKTVLNESNRLATVSGAKTYTFEEIEAEYLNDKDPMSWQELKDLGKILQPGCRSLEKWMLSGYEVHAALFSNDADFVSDDGSTSRVEEPQFAATYDFLHDIQFGDDRLMAGADGAGTDKGYTSFVGKKSIFSWLGPWNCATLWGTTSASDYFTNQIKLLPAPYGPGADNVFGTEDDGKSTCYIGSIGYCISAREKTTSVKKAAALKLAKYLCYDEETQRNFYSLGQQVPNIATMANGEYLAMTTVNSKGTQYPVNPVNLDVFVDVVDGFRDENDKVGGKARSLTRTLGSEWKTQWDKLVSQRKYYQNESMRASELVSAYKDTINKWLAKYNEELGR